MASRIGSVGGGGEGVSKSRTARKSSVEGGFLTVGDGPAPGEEGFRRQILNIDGVQFDARAPRGTYLDIFV